MKTLILIMSLSILASCNGTTAKKVEDCTYNDVKVSCSALKSSAIETDVTTAISVDREREEIEFLENVSDKKIINDKQGNERECGVETTAGQIIRFQVQGDVLFVRMNGETGQFKRLTGNRNDLNGKWFNASTDDGVTVEQQITISKNNKMRIQGACIF